MVIHLKAAHPLGCWAWCPPGLSSPAGRRNGFDRTLFTGGGGYPLVHDTVISRRPPLSLVLKDSWQLYQFVLFEEKAVLSYLKGRRKKPLLFIDYEKELVGVKGHLATNYAYCIMSRDRVLELLIIRVKVRIKC